MTFPNVTQTFVVKIVAGLPSGEFCEVGKEVHWLNTWFFQQFLKFLLLINDFHIFFIIKKHKILCDWLYYCFSLWFLLYTTINNPCKSCLLLIVWWEIRRPVLPVLSYCCSRAASYNLQFLLTVKMTICTSLPKGIFQVMFSIISIEFFNLRPEQNGYLMAYFGIVQMVSDHIQILKLRRATASCVARDDSRL